MLWAVPPPPSRSGTIVLTAGPLALAALLVATAATSGRCCDTPLSAWLAFTFYTVVGGVVLRHQSRNTVGWLLAAMGLLGLAGNAAEMAEALGIGPGWWHDLALWMIAWYFFGFLGIFVLLIHVFPTGRPLAGWIRYGYLAAVGGSTLLALRYMVGPPDEGMNPFQIDALDPILAVLDGTTVGLLLIGLATGVVSLGMRFRRARGVERDQMKWMFWGTAMALLLLNGGSALVEVLPSGLQWVGSIVETATFMLPGLAIAIAITRHRLFDIDRIVSRTVSYTAVGVVVVAAYGVPVVLLPEILGLSSDLAVAAATLAAAAVFNPVRNRIQRWVDRRFDRARYDAEREIETFSMRLGQDPGLAALQADVGAVLTRTLGPSTLTAWYLATTDEAGGAAR